MLGPAGCQWQGQSLDPSTETSPRGPSSSVQLHQGTRVLVLLCVVATRNSYSSCQQLSPLLTRRFSRQIIKCRFLGPRPSDGLTLKVWGAAWTLHCTKHPGSERRTLAPEKHRPPVRCLWSSAMVWIFQNGRQTELSLSLWLF